MFVSYAQNFEDVMLYRALREVENGFYVDVGANDPVVDSVTKAFYDRGWHGINIEPVTAWHERLNAERPRDINLRVAISSRSQSIPFYEVAETGRSTASKIVARKSAAAGHGFTKTTVPACTLDSVLQEHGTPEIHFLKIDVEGAERDVLSTIDLGRLRPWILVIEATKPGTPIPNFEDWESLLTAKDYSFAYFDGLNRFYVAAEHRDLADRLRVPPNLFDTFVRHTEQAAFERSQQLDAEIKLARAELLAVVNERDASSQRAIRLEGEWLSATRLIEIAKEERARVEERIGELTNTVEAAAREIDELAQQNAATRREVDEITRQYSAARREIDDLTQRREEDRHSLDESVQRYTAALREIDDLTQRREGDRRALDASTLQLGVARDRAAQVAAQLRIAHGRIGQLTRQRDEAGDRVKELEEQAAASANEIASVNLARSAALERAERTEAERNAAQATVDDLHRRLHHWWNVAEAGQHELRVIHASRSWRMTAPLRRTREMVKRFLRAPAAALIRFVLARRRLKSAASRVLRGLPSLRARLRSFAHARGLILHEMTGTPAREEPDDSVFEADRADRTRRARRIYDELMAARNANRGNSA